MKYSRWRLVDPLLILMGLGLTLFGLVLVYTASLGPDKSPSQLFWRQALYAAVGMAGLGLASAVHYRVYRHMAYVLYLTGLFLLVLVMLAGHGQEELGAQRWLDLRIFPLQPSEPAKLLVIIALARFLSDPERKTLPLWKLGASAAMVAVPITLVYLQPDLGTSASFAAIWLGMILVAGLHPLHGAAMATASVMALPLGWMAMRDYMRERLFTFLNPERDPFGAGYNVLQARISIGSGGFWGKGLTNGTQTQLRYLRVSHTDFIFSVLAEELGFMGAMALLAMLFGLVLRVLWVSDKAVDEFGRLVAVGIASMLAFQTIVNVGSNLSIMPATGIPLPFISYGGSALITNLVALGVLQSLLIGRFKYRY